MFNALNAAAGSSSYFSDWKKIGLSCTGVGLFLYALGIVLLLDAPLIIMGSVVFLAGLGMTLGLQGFLRLFFQNIRNDSKKIKGTGLLLGGLLYLLFVQRWVIIGIAAQLAGGLFLFGSFIPTALYFVKSWIPGLGGSSGGNDAPRLPVQSSVELEKDPSALPLADKK